MVIYTPIYLIKYIGLGWDQLGLILTVMLIPFIIFGLLVGILVDKFKVHKTHLLYIGFFIISLSTCLITFTTTKSMVIWASILFLTRVGASIIETTSEIYFFTHAREEDSHLLGFFRDMSPVAYIIAPLLGTIIFFFVPFKYLFLILGFILLLGLYYIPKLRHNHELNIPN
jgi:MFS family permease